MAYNDLIEQQEKEINEFSKNKVYFIFASSEEEFINKLNEKNLNPADLTAIGGGGYVLTQYKDDLMDLLEKHEEERHNYLLSNIYEVIKYYLWDFEMAFSTSMSLNELLYDYLDLTENEVKANADEINKAISDYNAEFNEINN